MVDAVFQGYSRFFHMEELRKNPAYLLICGGAASSEKIYCATLVLLLQGCLAGDQQGAVMQVNTEGIREVASGFDDSVITVFGKEGCYNVGYNPKYHGRPSYKLILI